MGATRLELSALVPVFGSQDKGTISLLFNLHGNNYSQAKFFPLAKQIKPLLMSYNSLAPFAEF